MSSEQHPDARLLVALTKLDALAADVSEMRAGLTRLADAYTRFAVVEERQSSSNGARLVAVLRPRLSRTCCQRILPRLLGRPWNLEPVWLLRAPLVPLEAQPEH